jgi:hypothetical protein
MLNVSKIECNHGPDETLTTLQLAWPHLQGPSAVAVPTRFISSERHQAQDARSTTCAVEEER